MDFIGPGASTDNQSYCVEENEWAMTKDVNLWKKCIDCNDENMDNDDIPLVPNDTSDDESTYSASRSGKY